MVLCILCPAVAQSQSTDSQTILTDRTGDALVSVLAFGDSLTRGVGDGIAPGQSVVTVPLIPGGSGYPAQAEAILGVPVNNAGVPGERFSDTGIYRLQSAVSASSADVVILFEGSNDANRLTATSTITRTMQRAVNIVYALGRLPVVATLPPPCCNHEGQAPPTRAYNSAYRDLAAYNQIPLIDLESAWDQSCPDLTSCRFYNLPEGLHPNSLGYTAISQMVASRLLGFDILTVTGAADFALATMIDPSTISITPRPEPPL